MKKNETKDAAEIFDDFLVYTGCCERPEVYDGAVLICPTTDSLDIGVALDGVTPHDVGLYWDCKAISNRGGFMAMTHHKRMTISDFMGLGGLKEFGFVDRYQYISRISEYYVNNDASVFVNDYFMGYRNGKWKLAYDPSKIDSVIGGELWRHGFTKKEQKKMTRKSEIMLGLTYILPSLWTASISMYGSPRIVIPTDPIGVRKLWEFRDLPLGKSRRSSLLHWVSNHWRQDRQDHKSEIYVRDHMRGNEKFETHGISVEIKASESDQNKLLDTIENRRLMSIRKVARRRRIRR